MKSPSQGLVGPTSAADRESRPPRTRDVTLTSTTLRIAEAGSGQPLLLINGLGTGIHTWWPFAQRLGKSRRLIMLDAPGGRGSIGVRRPLRMPGLARLVAELCDELGDTQIDVLGYSWGGALALQFAHEAPRRVRRLVLASTSPGVGGRLPSPGVLASGFREGFARRGRLYEKSALNWENRACLRSCPHPVREALSR